MTAETADALIILAAKYGPQWVLELLTLAKAPDATADDWIKLFTDVKPYAAYFPETDPLSTPTPKPA